MLYHATSCYIMLHHVTSCYIMEHHVTSRYIMLHRATCTSCYSTTSQAHLLRVNRVGSLCDVVQTGIDDGKDLPMAIGIASDQLLVA